MVTSCKERHCSLYLNSSIKNKLIFKGEKLEEIFNNLQGDQRHQAADFVVVIAEREFNGVLIIEMKSKHLHQLLDQLECTGTRVIQMKDFCSLTTDLAKYRNRIYFFAVANGGSSAEWGRLASNKIHLNGSKHSIISLRCGDDPLQKLKALF